MTDPGNVFVVRGDITRCQADAVVFSTSVELRGGGEMQSSFSEWPGFQGWYSELRSKGRREIGDTDWLAPSADKPGVVLVRSVGVVDPRDPAPQAAASLLKALERAEKELRQSRKPGPWLVLVPALMAGRGGGHERRLDIAVVSVASSVSRSMRSWLAVPSPARDADEDARVSLDGHGTAGPLQLATIVMVCVLRPRRARSTQHPESQSKRRRPSDAREGLCEAEPDVWEIGWGS